MFGEESDREYASGAEQQQLSRPVLKARRKKVSRKKLKKGSNDSLNKAKRQRSNSQSSQSSQESKGSVMKIMGARQVSGSIDLTIHGIEDPASPSYAPSLASTAHGSGFGSGDALDDPFFGGLPFGHPDYQLLRPLEVHTEPAPKLAANSNEVAFGHRGDFLLEYQTNPFVPEVYHRSACFLMLNEFGKLQQYNKLDRVKVLNNM